MRVVPSLLLLFFSSYPGVLRAQSTNGSVAGRGADPGKAVLEEPKIAPINEGTNARYEDATIGWGEYNPRNMTAGRLWHRNRET